MEALLGGEAVPTMRVLRNAAKLSDRLELKTEKAEARLRQWTEHPRVKMKAGEEAEELLTSE